MRDLKFDYDDISITPEVLTDINSRYENINPYYDRGTIPYSRQLPLFTAPMDSVVSNKNISDFIKNKIGVVMPRTMSEYSRYSDTFRSYGLKDTPEIVGSGYVEHVLLDVANGHMKQVINWCERVKKENPHIKLMAGNIANPETFVAYHKSGVIDYVRVGIGNGNGCLTTQQTGIGYPTGSLVRECYIKKQIYRSKLKIVADGGIKKYPDIIKALALGADYVMIGSLFAKAIESAAPNYFYGFKVSNENAMWLYKNGFTIEKEYRGMSTKGAQKALGNKILKTSEGVIRRYKVEYTLEKWVQNFESYLRSNMSYTNSKTLEDFIGKVDYTFITQNSFNRYNK